MKKNRFLPNSGGMMIELVIGIVLFIVISLFTFNIFLKTEQCKNEADELSKAMFRAESVMERIRASESRQTANDGIMKKTIVGEKAEYLVGYYDKDWKKSYDKDRYEITIKVDEEQKGRGILSKYTVKIYKTQNDSERQEIYSLTSKVFWDGGAV